ncbi:biotin--[acetyl-CoA-carboxylase] ligase [Wolbachia endosymbiont of Howardula sp.]|uniref:biotin--[acetyl-CoA-carboxylase] ligase n=1 Tax=Wolbachia endosymbiont of Howardula sp. TaxID=2916816 RepID=UPI00217EED42|nr:biotin--[acetyl-CoA-carboxylase] ligase [Wolbachia endosymbiont of Howardula sp.]UWI83217.1 biotin--[acetyl-CoA-carboxylase] ligase [Wolbachia endosymbiont of Howardula sp.]
MQNISEDFHIYHYKEVLSTNESAFQMIENGLSSESIIIANKQVKGKGRIGKKWISLEKNFYGSLIIKQMTNIEKLTELTFVTALAVGETLKSFGHNFNIQYKWPNDILMDSKKISGILIEKKSYSNWIVIGIGINIHDSPISCVSTSLYEYMNKEDLKISNLILLNKLIINFIKIRKKWLDHGFNIIRNMWLMKALNIEQKISIQLSHKVYEGTFIDIDDKGQLILKIKDSSLMYFNAGELFFNNLL